ncbi:hypothetical protein OBBRIDRAFT_330754 [Obba rivulosa]|uniref:Uncharacterized protein n=1 Tax=Obba rivulosa TaxID=1052685 RepID=A0A8E2AKU7_9APHY|nr:hypothetical protein OBBRIDRAFT_330754 [Obba rivulosa]
MLTASTSRKRVRFSAISPRPLKKPRRAPRQEVEPCKVPLVPTLDTVPDDVSEAQHRAWDEEFLKNLGPIDWDLNRPIYSYLFIGSFVGVAEDLYDYASIACGTIMLQCEESKDLCSAISEAFKRKDFRRIRCLKIFRKRCPHEDQELERAYCGSCPTKAEIKAIVRSWKAPYLGNADRALYEHIVENANSGVRVTPVIQALGSGKSRTVDELSKLHLVIPVNFSPEGSYPPPDSALRDWFLKKSAKATIRRTSECYIDALVVHDGHAFFYIFYSALFKTTTRYIRNGIRVAIEKEEALDELQKSTALTSFPTSLAGQFRLFMSLGQTYHTQGILRRKFYQDVMESADSFTLLHHIDIGSDSGFSDEEYRCEELYVHTQRAAQEMIQALVDVGYLNSADIDAEDVWSLPPRMFVSFDGAEALMRYYVSKGVLYWSRMCSLVYASRAFCRMPISTLVLSSAWLPIQPVPMPPPERSARLSMRSPSVTPFSFLGFDNLIADDKLVEDGSWTLDKVTQPEFWLKLGRPLWGRRFKYGSKLVKGSLIEYAAQLLLGGSTEYDTSHLSESQLLGVLAPRLALEFKPGPRHPGVYGGDVEMNQVEKHLRMCLALDPYSPSRATWTVATSEPTVVEAAAWIMRRRGFESCKALRYVLQNTRLWRGYRGELIMVNIIIDTLDKCTFDKISGTRARFVVSVPEFFRQLLRSNAFYNLMQTPPSHGTGTFTEVFKESRMYITHFIRVLDPGVLSREILMRCIVRGAAIICANREGQVDLVLPFLHGSNELRPSNVSAVLVQAPMDTSYSDVSRLTCFDRMDPFVKNMFFGGEEALPVIRLVCALNVPFQGDGGNTTPLASVHRREQLFARCAGRRRAPCTVFDVWCAGVSSRTFRSIGTKHDKAYEELLDMVTSEVCTKNSSITDVNFSTTCHCAFSLYPSATVLNDSWAHFTVV